MWTNSAFGQAIDADEIDFPFPKKIPNTDVSLPYVFIGDKAFPLDTHMMRPYVRTYRRFGDAERIFNKMAYPEKRSVLCTTNGRRYCKSDCMLS